MVVADCYSKFFISNYGHVMGAKIEYNMRAEIFEHLQKLSFSFYDNQKVGQLMSRITTDLFDITELMHHGPENIILSAIKIIGAFVILVNISPLLALAAFIVLPFMFAYAYYLNGKMRRAFRQNRVKIAEINGQIEDNLSGIRVVKSFANEEIEKKKFKIGNAGFLSAKKNSYHYMGSFQAGLGAFTPSAGSPLVWLADRMGNPGYLIGYAALVFLCMLLMDAGYLIVAGRRNQKLFF